jgi:Protein of unknown function (DUF2523).
MAVPAFFIPIIPVLTIILVSTVGRILSSLGLIVVTYYGISYLVDTLYSHIHMSTYGLDSKVMTFVNMFQVLPALKLICSAYVAKYVISGFKKIAFRGS